VQQSAQTILILLLMVVPISLGFVTVVQAHGGGYPQISNQPVGPYRVSVWTQPQPLRAGSQAHFTIAISKPLGKPGSLAENAGVPVLGADVQVELIPLSGNTSTLMLQAKSGSGINKLYYETDVEMPAAGRWEVFLAINGDEGGGSTMFEIEVEPPSTTRWILWVSAAVIGLTAAWSARAYQHGTGIRKIILVLAVTSVLTVSGSAAAAHLTGPTLPAIVSSPASRFWPFGSSAEPDLVIEVQASQWKWVFNYPAAGVQSTELNLPQGQTALIKIDSTDVLHSFAVPDFDLNENVLPGKSTFVKITPLESGKYVLTCESFCGVGFADMLADVQVLPAKDFDAWLAQEKTKQLND